MGLILLTCGSVFAAGRIEKAILKVIMVHVLAMWKEILLKDFVRNACLCAWIGLMYKVFMKCCFVCFSVSYWYVCRT